METISPSVNTGSRATPLLPSLRTLLVLGRISNLPTVWSNCLAAWLLAGAGSWLRFAVLCLGATLIYTGGMFLNDAFDVEFDREHRAERPIVSGCASSRFVWLAGILLLACGLISISSLGTASALLSSLLVAVVVAYDATHKLTRFAPFLMGACRFLLYVVAGSTAPLGITSGVVLRATALLAYILGLSYIARTESTQPQPVRWPVPLLLAPIGVALATSAVNSPAAWFAILALTGWILWCFAGPTRRVFFRTGVAGLLAGIPLVDWLASAPTTTGDASLALVFLGLFVSALVLQQVAPAT